MQEIQRLFTEAVSLHQSHKLAEAESLYLQVHQLLPENINVLANLSIVCRDLEKLTEAEEYCRQAIALAPNDPDQYLNLGAVLEAKKDLPAAQHAYEKALKRAPNHPKLLNNLGKLFHQLGFLEKGLELIEQAVRLEPDYPLALNNLGVIYSERGDLLRAENCLERSVALDPNNINALYNLAGVYNARNNFTQARTTLQQLLKIDPQHQATGHMLAALSGTTTPTAPRQYVEEIFDKYAGRFDVHLQGTLGYTVPATLALMLQETVSSALPFAATLDLGCGTGLSGASFKEMSEYLVGVDISGQMLAKAAEKGIYHRLEKEEILTFLQVEGERYDLFIAADVLVYLGDPRPFFSGIAGRSKEGAIIACSIERSIGTEDFILLPSGRYAHNPHRLQATAATAGFVVLKHQAHGIRKEDGEWLPGDLFLFKKESSGLPQM